MNQKALRKLRRIAEGDKDMYRELKRLSRSHKDLIQALVDDPLGREKIAMFMAQPKTETE